MSLLDQLYAEENENSLEQILGISSSPSESSPMPILLMPHPEDKPISVTYNWLWNDE